MAEPQIGSAREDRIGEVNRVLSAARGTSIVLYGKRSSGKTEWILDSLFPSLARQFPVYYGECGPDLPDRLRSRDGDLPVDWTAVPPGVVILDNFDQILALPERSRRENAKKLAAAAQQGRLTVALVVCEENLRAVFALRDILPGITDNLFELPAFSLSESLAGLAAAEPSAFSYDPRLLETIQKDLEQFRHSNVSPALSHLLHARLKACPGRPVGIADYHGAGGLTGILKEHLNRRMETLGQELGTDAVEAGWAVLEEVAAAGAGTPPRLREIPSRLGAAPQVVTAAAERLQTSDSLLRSLPGGKFDIRPAQLSELLQNESELRRRELEPVQRGLEEAVRAWGELGSLLPRERFEGVQGLRKNLRVTQEQAVLLTHCALHYAIGENCDVPRYWLARIPDRSEQAATLMRAVFNPLAEVRARAVRLMGDFDEPEIRHQLYRMALEDGDLAVRSQALASLDRQQIDDFRERLEEESKDRASPYRVNALVALRLFRDRRSAAFLQSVVNDPAAELPLRGAAIDSLAFMGIPEAVDALVRIALEDEDVEDREAAASALATIDSEELQSAALEKIRQGRRAEEPHRPVGYRGALAVLGGVLLALLVVAGNLGLHGLALLVLRRFKWAAAFCGLEVVAVGVIALPGPGASGIVRNAGWLALLLNLLACQLAAFRAAQIETPAARTSFRATLSFLLLLPNLLTFLLFHGLAHLLLKQVRRSFALFGLELLGIGCASILFIYRDLFAVSELPAAGIGHILARHVPEILRWFYGLSAAFLFAGSFLWDITGTGYQVLRSRRRLESERRRSLVYGKVMGNPAAAIVVLAGLQGTDRKKVRWAGRLVHRVAAGMPATVLVDWLGRNAETAPRAVVRALAHTKREDGLATLCGLWQQAAAPLRRCILRVLAIEPTENSLEWFRRLLPEAGPLWRLRYYVSAIDYRIRLWPKPLLILGTWLLPSVLLLFYEGAATAKEETRPLIKSIRVTATAMAKPGWVPHRPAQDQPSVEERRVVETARFLARRYPEESVARSLLEVLRYLQQAGGAETRETRRGLTNSLLTLTGQSGAPGRIARKAITGMLSDSEEPQRQMEVTEMLLQAGSDQVRQPWRASLATQQEAARGVLIENVRALKRALFSNLDTSLKLKTIGYLEAAGNQEAVDALREFIVKPGTPAELSARLDRRAASDLEFAVEARPHVEGVRQLQNSAVRSLGRIGTPAAGAALLAVAGDKTIPDNLRRSARAQEREMLAGRMAEVRAAFGSGEFEKAIALGGKLLGSTPSLPGRPELMKILGEASYRQALAVSQTDPEKAPSLQDDAIRYLEQARAAGNRTPETIRLLALAHAAKARRLLDSNKTQAALTEARQALRVDPKCDEANAALGSALLEAGDRTGALRAFADATAISPGYTYAYYMQVQILTGDRKYAEAEQMIVKAVAADPDAGWTYQLLGRIYLDQNRVPELVSLLKSMSAKYSGSIYPLQELGYVYHEYMAPSDPAKYRAACDIYRQIRGMLSDDRVAEKQQTEASIAECSLTTGRYEDAVRSAETVIRQTADYQLPMQLIAYAAKVAAADYNAARAQLDDIEMSVHGPGAKPQYSWVYDGTLAYLESTAIPEPAKGALLELVSAVNDAGNVPAGKKAPQVPATLFDKNREALRHLTITKWLKD